MTRSQAVHDLIDALEAEAATDRDPEATPEVGIVMGSDSDLDTMYGAYEALTELGFEEVTDYDDPPEARFTFETYVVSAHRTPELLYAYGETARERGLDVVIAGRIAVGVHQLGRQVRGPAEHDRLHRLPAAGGRGAGPGEVRRLGRGDADGCAHRRRRRRQVVQRGPVGGPDSGSWVHGT